MMNFNKVIEELIFVHILLKAWEWLHSDILSQPSLQLTLCIRIGEIIVFH